MRVRRSLSARVAQSVTLALVVLVGPLTPIGNRLALAVSGNGGQSHAPLREGWREKPLVRDAIDDHGERCLACHGHIENVTENMGFELDCTFCHGGDPVSTVKEIAHVQPSLPIINDATVAPLDYDLDYQRFVNPSNLRVVPWTCGYCHFVDNIPKAMMATAAGHYAGGMYLGGVIPSKTPVYGTFAVTDDDGDVPTEDGAVAGLLDLVTYDPELDPSLYSTHYRAVPAQACARCHLWSRGKGYRGAVEQDGLYRADGCAACHMPYANNGLSQSADASINHMEPGHPRVHTVKREIPSEQCIHCHHRGARIGLSFTGRAQMPPRLPSGPGVAGTTDQRFNSNYHYTDPETNPRDIHNERGLHCIDCHTAAGVMGDGNIYGHMDQATKTECRQCHGTPDALATLTDHDGLPLSNLRQSGDSVRLASKVDGRVHAVTQVKELVDHTSPAYNPQASCAMNDDHIKTDGGLECYSCHTSWVPNCYGCHFERDERQMGQNLVTREWEVGKVTTNNKIFESLRNFHMGTNSEGRVTPFIVGCQVYADVTAPDGSKILDFASPETVNGLSGLGLQPVNPHSVRGAGEVRTCAECHRAPPALGLGSGNYAVARNYAFATSTAGVQVFDRRADPTSPVLVGTIPVSDPLALAALPDVVEGTTDFLYVAAGTDGVDIFDLQSGIPVSPVGGITGIHAIDVARAARYLYVVVDGVGVNIYDNLDPAVATYIAGVPIPSARRVVPWGIHLFVAAGTAGLYVVDIADNGAPIVVQSVPGMNAVDVALYAHMRKGPEFASRAYVADPGFGVRVVDLLPDFASASLVGGFPLPGATGLDTYTRYVETQGTTPSREHDYLYVAAGTGGLRVLDITDPDAIAEVGAVTDLGGSVVDVDVSSEMTPPGVDDYAVVANGQLGVQIVDVTNPQNPSLIRALAASGTGRVFVEVQQLDRYIDEQGNELKENSHPNAGTFSRADIVRILGAEVNACLVGGCCETGNVCNVMSNADCTSFDGVFGGDGATCDDADLDGVGEACDCAPSNDQAWNLPGRIDELLLSHVGGVSGTTTLSWTPADPGATQVQYDTLTSLSPSDFEQSAGCLEADDLDTQATHTTDPGSGVVLYFLVVAENPCGPGSAGDGLSGLPRSVLDCL